MGYGAVTAPLGRFFGVVDLLVGVIDLSAV
jgi:hypothetical protein